MFKIFSSLFTELFLPVIIAVALGGVLGFVLSFLSVKLKVNKDKRVKKVRENLCGTNCGGCGYAGCDAFAQALVNGEAKLESCRPTKESAKLRIAEYLGIENKFDEQHIAVVHCNGGVDSLDKGGYQGYGDCKSANLLAGGNKECEVACIGLGSCVKSCHYNAISVCKERGVAKVDKHKCIMCGACIEACPKGIISEIPLHSVVYVACSNTCNGRTATAQCKVCCIACGKCVKACPHDAMKVIDNLARIDYSKCTACGECVKVCPRKCILVR